MHAGGPDVFGASRAAFDALTTTLASATAGGWTHDQLEDHLATHGRELLRRLLQDHLDLRAVREQHAIAAGLTPQPRKGIDTCIGCLQANGSSWPTTPPWRPAGRSPPA